MPASFRQIIDKAVKEKRFLVVPGAHDALTARHHPEARLRDLFHRRLSGGRRALRRAGRGAEGLRRNRGLRARHHGGLRPAGVRRRRRRLRRRQERGPHRAELRAHGRQRDPDRGPAMAQALRPHGRQEGGADRDCRGQDQGRLLGAASTRRPGFWRAPTRARSTTSTRRCAAPSARSAPAPTASSSRRRAASKELETHRQSLRRAADLQSADGRPHADPDHGGAGRARLQLRGARPRHRDARRQGDREPCCST